MNLGNIKFESMKKIETQCAAYKVLGIIKIEHRTLNGMLLHKN